MNRTSNPKRILEVTSYPPPRAGWGVRVEFIKKHLEAAGHECVVLNVGRSRFIKSDEYEGVMGGLDYIRKVWKFSRAGFVVHMHVNGESPKGFVLTLIAEIINLAFGRRCLITFHAGVDQVYFPRPKYPVLWPMFWLIFAIPRRIICNSEAVKAKIQEYGVDERKIVPIAAFTRQYLEFDRVALEPHIEEFYSRFPTVLFTYIRIRDGFYLDTLLDGFARLAATRADVGLAFCGVSGDIDETLWRDVQARIATLGLADRICIIDDLGHDAFRVALVRSAVYVRTPTTDGVASSVLESLALKVPVVASENGMRPAGTVTYRADDPGHLADVVQRVIENRAAVIAAIPEFEIPDTLNAEIELLCA